MNYAMNIGAASTNAPSFAAPRIDTDRAIARWLFLCAALVLAMVVVGGVTRLTHSGLSIVEWQPIVGTLPPLSEAQWETTFAKYRETPEYKFVNRGMSLAEFKGIFWWEYFHRLLGRLIGIVFFVPLVWFALRRRIRGMLTWKLAAIFVLGALQGAMGWYMVKSGLVDNPRVSHFRLTAHLSLAFLIFAAMVWVALDLLHPRRDGGADAARVRKWGGWSLALIAFMVLTGGLVAGLRAGLAYNTFPLMNGYVVPPEIFMIEPWWRNFFYNMATVQFDHRLGAWALALVLPILWWRARRASISQRARRSIDLLALAVAGQIALGIATLLTRVNVPLAVAHQGWAVIVLAAALATVHALR